MRQVVEQLQKALDSQLAVNNPNDEKKVEEEAKQAAGDEKNGVKSKDPPPSPLPQDIVLSTFMHCENCARKVQRCLKGFEGVEDVLTDCEAHKVIVKGEKADPWKVLERVKKKYNRKVELLFPEQKPQPEERKKRKQEQHAKTQQKKDVEVSNYYYYFFHALVV
ncbi:uncharacterized protein LOC143612575 [Bidens hawaiensis]|uniref:uncharacterized protein LOC143612575 n=1 Tax=Bidens hawaiensis TaxID=980011 RepID=UPI00404AA35E